MFWLKRENDDLKREVDDLKSENKDLRRELRAGGGGSGVGGIDRGGSEDSSLLSRKVSYLQETITELERERSKLLVRATSAEEQLVETQKQMDDMIKDHTKEVMRLQKGKL